MSYSSGSAYNNRRPRDSISSTCSAALQREHQHLAMTTDERSKTYMTNLRRSLSNKTIHNQDPKAQQEKLNIHHNFMAGSTTSGLTYTYT